MTNTPDASLPETTTLPLPLAFSSVACPDWPLGKLLEQAHGWGYRGVELRSTHLSGGAKLASDPLREIEAAASALQSVPEVKPVCLSTSAVLGEVERGRIRRASEEVRQALKAAKRLNIPAVRVFADHAQPSTALEGRLRRLVSQLPPLMQEAAELGVELMIENTGLFATSSRCWQLLEMLEAPAGLVKLAWSISSAALAGEPPSVSLPTLHSRIGLLKLKSFPIRDGQLVQPPGLGAKRVDLPGVFTRLMGLGYGGFVCVEWDRLWTQTIQPGETYLPQAYRSLADALAKIVESQQPAKPKAAKGGPKGGGKGAKPRSVPAEA
jgi:sugar phosphate isomerase/epimerase